MSLLRYIDNEVPAFGEWDSVVTAGGSTIVQSADAAFPERGGVGLRLTTTAGNNTYVEKTGIGHSIAAGESIFIGFWFNVQAKPDNYTSILSVRNAAGNVLGRLYMWANGTTKGVVYSDAVVGAWTAYTADISGWGLTYVVLEIRRATTNVAADGYARVYFNGAIAQTSAGSDNYDRCVDLASVRVGVDSSARDGLILDYDEVKISDTYPEPFVPTPLTEYPEARRTVVLYRQASSDSREFADYCVSELDVPRSNLCPLPSATGNETLADYATFQTEVETDLAAWLALNPTVAANCSCFLIGHGVPGYFTANSIQHSAVSRLMNYGTAFSSGTDNPLYNPATVARLTKTDLGGKHLCSRIDADTLQHAKDVLDCGLQIADCGFLPATDKLYSDDSTYRASLACQHLRIITEGLGAFADDAFVWGDCGSPSFGSAGSRAVFTDDSADSADTLRATSELFDAIVTNAYAAGLGFSATPSTLLPTPFFEMLRLGGSLAEAFAVAVAKLDYTAVGIGSPLMTVAFGEGGYNVYRGLGGIEGIDWGNPVAYLRAGQDNITFDQDLPPGRSYVYAVRAVSSAGVEERNTHIITYVEPDEQGDLLPAPLARPTDLTADVQQSSLLIGFSYYAPVGFSDADGFDVLGDNGTGQLDLDNPIATLERSRHDRFDFEVSIDRPGTPVLLAVRARQDQRTGPISEILFVPLIPAPAPVKPL